MLKSKLAQEKGYSLVEMIMVMALLVIFGISIFTLVISGSNAYSKITANKDIENGVRIINSALNIRVRQHDVQGMVRVEEHEIAGEIVQTLTLEEHLPNEEPLVTYIYWLDNQLWECLTSLGEKPDMSLSLSLMENEDLSLSFEKKDNSIYHTISYYYNGYQKTLQNQTFLRSEE